MLFLSQPHDATSQSYRPERNTKSTLLMELKNQSAQIGLNYFQGYIEGRSQWLPAAAVAAAAAAAGEQPYIDWQLCTERS